MPRLRRPTMILNVVVNMCAGAGKSSPNGGYAAIRSHFPKPLTVIWTFNTECPHRLIEHQQG